MDERKKYRLINLIEIPDLITILGIISALLAVQQSMVGHYLFSYFLLILCFIFDSIDGRIARWLGKGNRPFGEALDSLTDTLSFLIAPALVGYYLGFNLPLEQVLLGLFIIIGILRLARFSCVQELEHKTVGMPASYNVIIFTLLFLFHILFGLDKHLLFAAGFIFTTLMMGSTIPLPNI